jgi:glycine/D-amino acid oxidase-like deaminating enzyme
VISWLSAPASVDTACALHRADGRGYHFCLAGINTTYALAERDPAKKIILIDDGEICSGETGRTTAHMQIEIDDHYYSVAHMFGEEVARLVCQSNHEAVEFIENVVTKEKIDCEFERLPGYLIPYKESHIADIIDKEFKASSKAGMAVELLDSDDKLPKYPTDYPRAHWLRFRNQGQFHPLKYLYALTQILTTKFKNVEIYTNTHVLEINDDNKEDGTGEVYVTTSDNTRVDCKKMVLAT